MRRWFVQFVLAGCAMLAPSGLFAQPTPPAPAPATPAAPATRREAGTYVCKLDGSDEARLGGPTTPAWLPAGNQVLMATTNRLYRVNVDGSGKMELWRDPETVMLLSLCVSPSGRYAAALGIQRSGAGLVKVWRLADKPGETKLVLDDLLYNDAVTEKPNAKGEGARYLSAILAWNASADLLAWAPMEYQGLSKRTRSVKVYDAAAGRWSTWYLDKEVWSLTWHADRPSLMVTCGSPGRPRTPDDPPPPVSLVEVSDGGQKKVTLARSVRDGGAGDAPMTWLPKCGIFAWGQSLYGADGEVVPPELPEGDGPVARLVWVSESGRDLLLATSHVTDSGDVATDLMQGLTGADWRSFHRLLRLPVMPRQVHCTPDGSRVSFVVGGYLPD